MLDFFLYILCGLSAGLLAGYLGIGGGIIVVPFLTVLAGVDIKAAVPVSVTAIVVNSFSGSSEYLKRGMVDLELVIILSFFSVLGNLVGTQLSTVVSGECIRVILTVVLIYTAFSLLKKKTITERLTYTDNRGKYLFMATFVSFATGTLAALVGIGGGVIVVPLLYLVIGVPLAIARGTSLMMTGFSGAAAATVYFLRGEIDPEIVTGVVVGIILGGKLGGFLGTMAKPAVVKVVFFVIMLYLAFRLAYEPLMELL